MILNVLRAAFLAISLTAFSAHAALITSLSNLNIGGTLYNATFHAGQTFNDLFDKDGDGIFNDTDGSIFNRAPIFWGDRSNALNAATAILGALSSDDFLDTDDIDGTRYDGFLVTYQFLADPERISSIGDADFLLTSDRRAQIGGNVAFNNDKFTYVTFNRVPTPPTLALSALALGIMGFMGRRRRA